MPEEVDRTMTLTCTFSVAAVAQAQRRNAHAAALLLPLLTGIKPAGWHVLLGTCCGGTCWVHQP
jgi:hypothetical protein